MIRQAFAILLSVSFISILSAEDPQAPDAARVKMLTTIGKKLDQYTKEFRETGSRAHSSQMQALLQEAGKHPAPKDADAKKFTALMPGKWASPRHEYAYKKSGAYVMLPEEKDATQGKWRFKGNQFIQTDGDTDTAYTVILLDKDFFIYRDKDAVFFMSRAK